MVQHFQREHDQIKSDLDGLRALTWEGIAVNAQDIADHLQVMSTHVAVHLASEDRTLYPMLAATGDPAIAGMASRYQAEMGGLASIFHGFVERWRIAAHVAGDPEGFRMASKPVLRALHERLFREESEFFPIIEARLSAA